MTFTFAVDILRLFADRSYTLVWEAITPFSLILFAVDTVCCMLYNGPRVVDVIQYTHFTLHVGADNNSSIDQRKHK